MEISENYMDPSKKDSKLTGNRVLSVEGHCVVEEDNKTFVIAECR